MPSSLPPIPLGTQIVDADGAITIFFRQLWQQLITGFQLVPTVAALTKNPLSAALVTTAVFTTKAQGLYRLSYYIRKTSTDGVSSSLTVTLGWLENGVALSQTFAALTLDSVTAEQNGSIVVEADESSDLTIAVAYASNTPGAMKYLARAVAEQMG